MALIAIILSGIWWYKEGGFEPVIVFITGISALFLSMRQKPTEPEHTERRILSVDDETLNELYERILCVEGTINKSFLDRRLWNELQENLDNLKRYYHENKVNFTTTLDEMVLEVIKVGRCVMSCKTNHPIPSELADAYRASKDKVVAEIRHLKIGENKI
ncbi:hypothetical protein MCT05_17715 [Vibrio aestuarianus]|nr:hypothetical protein [Vibrio aestuarianus]